MQIPPPLHRTNDPITSKLAASSARELQARHIALIYSALLDAGMVGMTKDELAAVTGLDATQVARRGKEGEDRFWTIGPETRRGRTGRLCRVWTALRA